MWRVVGYGGGSVDPVSAGSSGSSNGGEGDGSLRYLSRIEDSEWLSHIRRILQGSVSVAEKLELERVSVLVHCRYKHTAPRTTTNPTTTSIITYC